VSEYEQELDQPGLDDQERALRDAEKERDQEQDNADEDDDDAPSPLVDDQGEALL